MKQGSTPITEHNLKQTISSVKEFSDPRMQISSALKPNTTNKQTNKPEHSVTLRCTAPHSDCHCTKIWVTSSYLWTNSTACWLLNQPTNERTEISSPWEATHTLTWPAPTVMVEGLHFCALWPAVPKRSRFTTPPVLQQVFYCAPTPK